MFGRVAATTALLLTFGGLARAQDSGPVTGPDVLEGRRITQPPKIDGTIDAAEWAGLATSDRALVDIGTGSASGDRGQYWLAYDDEFIYFAARINLKDPKRIVADEFRDSVPLEGNDIVTLLIDVVGSTRDISFFEFNPNGATNLDIAGGRATKAEWLGRFTASARRIPTGWEGEARIPWSILPLPASGKRDIRYLVDWSVSSTGRGVSTHSTQGDFSKLHTLQGVDIPDIRRRNSVLLLPYAFGGIDRDNDHIADAGLDVKTSLSDRMTFVGTVNPDFRNIENDILSLNYSNFERLPEESRPFFREGANWLRTGSGPVLFASQRITEFDTGFNVYGNLDDRTQFGANATIDFGNQLTAASGAMVSLDPTLAVVGSLVALQRPGFDNIGANFEVFKRLGKFQVVGRYLRTDDEVVGDGNAMNIGATYRDRGFQSTFVASRVDRTFTPRIGFAPQRDYVGVAANAQLRQRYRGGPLSDSFTHIGVADQDRLGGQGNYRRGATAFGYLAFRNGVMFEYGFDTEQFLDKHNLLWSTEISYPHSNPYRRVAVSAVSGSIGGDSYRSYAASIRYRPWQRLQLGVRGQWVSYLQEQTQIIGTFNYQISKYDSFAGRAVRSDDDWNWYLSYRHSGGVGLEYFVIIGDPNSKTFQRQIIFKVVMPFSLG